MGSMGSMWSSTRRKFSRAVGGSQHLRTKPAFGFAGRHAAALHADPRRRALLHHDARARRQIRDERRIHLHACPQTSAVLARNDERDYPGCQKRIGSLHVTMRGHDDLTKNGAHRAGRLLARLTHGAAA